MATPPTFTAFTPLAASSLNSVGMWLVKSQTVGTGVSSVTVTGAFSADYNAYKIIYSGGVGSTDLRISLTLGSSASNYYMALPYVLYGSGTPSGTSLSAATTWALCGTATANGSSLNVDLLSPFLSQYTSVLGFYASDTEAGSYTGVHKTASSYTAFTLTTSTGTLTGGTVSVYGYRK